MRIIGGSKRGKTLRALEGFSTRPTLDRVRENIFNILQNRVASARVLDLFAGSGAMGCEALSRGAQCVVFNDSSREAAAVVKENVERLGFTKNARIWQFDWRVAVKKLLHDDTKFDIVLLDAPYQNDYIHECVAQCQLLLAQDGKIVVEHGKETVFAGIAPRRYGKAWVSVIGRE